MHQSEFEFQKRPSYRDRNYGDTVHIDAVVEDNELAQSPRMKKMLLIWAKRVWIQNVRWDTDELTLKPEELNLCCMKNKCGILEWCYRNSRLFREGYFWVPGVNSLRGSSSKDMNVVCTEIQRQENTRAGNSTTFVLNIDKTKDMRQTS